MRLGPGKKSNKSVKSNKSKKSKERKESMKRSPSPLARVVDSPEAGNLEHEREYQIYK